MRLSLLVVPTCSGFTHPVSIGLLSAGLVVQKSFGLKELNDCEESLFLRGGGATAHSREGDLGSMIVVLLVRVSFCFRTVLVRLDDLTVDTNGVEGETGLLYSSIEISRFTSFD